MRKEEVMARRKKKIRIVNGRSYQVNKKWSELSQVQKRWILADAKYHYDKLTADTSQPITNREKRKLLTDSKMIDNPFFL